MRRCQIIVACLLFSIPGQAAFNAFFWNIDAAEYALGGAVGALQGSGFGQNANPAGLPIGGGDTSQLRRILAFPNAFRMVAVFFVELGKLPYDAIADDDRWRASAHHAKWVALSLATLYRFEYQLGDLAFSLTPLREVPASGKRLVTASSVSAALQVAGMLRIGIEGSWYHSFSVGHLAPLALADREAVVESAWGGAAGMQFLLGSLTLGLDYRTRPGGLFPGEPCGLPVKNDAFSLSAALRPVPELQLAAELVNWNNTRRSDFLTPRFGASWEYYRRGKDGAQLFGSVWGDEGRRAFLGAGFGLEGVLEGLPFRGTLVLAYGLAVDAPDLLLFSFDLTM